MARDPTIPARLHPSITLMRFLMVLLALSTALFAQLPKPPPADDAVRIREFYRLSEQIQDKVWPGWSKTPAPLLLVTSDTEYLTHFPEPPKEFQKAGDDFTRDCGSSLPNRRRPSPRLAFLLSL